MTVLLKRPSGAGGAADSIKFARVGGDGGALGLGKVKLRKFSLKFVGRRTRKNLKDTAEALKNFLGVTIGFSIRQG